MTAMRRRYVRNDADLPDHDLVLEPADIARGLAYHVRHYVHHDAHVVIVGGFGVGPSYIVDAASVARELAEVVVPAGLEFAMVAYAPQSPLSGEPHFREVSFEVGDRVKRASSAWLAGPEVVVPRTRPVDLAAVETMAGRPVLTFPYRFYTRALVEAMNGQPAKRLLELLIEAGLVCPIHGPSPYGDYCGTGLACEQEHNRRARVWRAPYAPRRRSIAGGYRGIATRYQTQVEFASPRQSWSVPIFGRDAPELGWGYGGSRSPSRSWTAGLTTRAPPRNVAWWWLPDQREATGRRDRRTGWRRGSPQGLLDAGFDVYEPGRNGEAPSSRTQDHRLHGMLHASLLSALDQCSMLVVPYDGDAVMQGVECVTALRYVLEHPDVPAVLAYDRAEANDFVNHQTHGVLAIRVGDGMPRDVSAVVSAVDEACAAYECLHIATEA